MSKYQTHLPDVGPVKVSKKRGMRTLRLRVTPRGELVVSAPWFVSKAMIDKFVLSKKDWLIDRMAERRLKFYDGMMVGRETTLRIIEDSKSNRSKHKPSELHVYIKNRLDLKNQEQTNFIEKKVINALQTEAENLLLPRLEALAAETGHIFNQAFIKRLTGRWGGCDQAKNINLSLFLVQLPDELIDYVLTHELAHTKHLNHSPNFWAHVEQYCPDYKNHRRTLKKYEPSIIERLAV